MIIYGGRIGQVRLQDGGWSEALATIEVVTPPENPPGVLFTIRVAEYLSKPLEIQMSLGDNLVTEKAFGQAWPLVLEEHNYDATEGE
jgi:hypothetical protein